MARNRKQTVARGTVLFDVVYQDGTGDEWPATVDAWETHACAVAGRNLTRERLRGLRLQRVVARSAGCSRSAQALHPHRAPLCAHFPE